MFLSDPCADLEAAGLCRRNGSGYRLTESAEREYGWAFREFNARCRELEALGAWPEWATVLVLRETAALFAEDAGAG